jgi:DNA helicase HerA-like ATPase
MSFSAKVHEPLEALEDPSGRSIFIGRSQAIHRKYGREGALLLGSVAEEKRGGDFVYVDALMPHTVAIVGSKGSGKSYSLGIIAEEMVTKNPNVAVVIVDPIGIYWSMKFPNHEQKEIEELVRMGLQPKGVDGVRVFVPAGVSNTLPRDTYDRAFSLRPADLTVDDWCITFGIDRFSPTGLLLEKALEKVAVGYVNVDDKKISAKPQSYGIDDVVNCLEKDKDLASKAKGFKIETRRAIVSRFEAAKAWGVFSAEGTSLNELCREGEVSVIDVSFLDEKVTALVIGILARKILSARKLATRKTAVKRLGASAEELLETGIPPTWLFIDEAHTLVPSGGAKTAASDSLIEYVKLGRQPGCSLVMATQQPAAIDPKVISQLDILLCHKLVFDDDIKAVFKRIPSAIPKEYGQRFIRTLPIGFCLVGDRSDTTSRIFAAQIRPRFSQHEGRESRAVQFEEGISPGQIEQTLVSIVSKQVHDYGRVSSGKVEDLVNTINKRYKSSIRPDAVVQKVLGDTAFVYEDEAIILKGYSQKEDETPGAAEKRNATVQAFRAVLPVDAAKKMVLNARRGKLLGLFGDDETVKDFHLEYWPIYRVEYDRYQGSAFKRSVCFVDGMTGELLRGGKSLDSTRGLGKLTAMNKHKRRIVIALRKGKKASAKGLAGVLGITEAAVRTNAEELVSAGVLQAFDDKGSRAYATREKFDIPDAITEPEYSSVESASLMEEATGRVAEPRVPRESAEDVPSIWGEVKIRGVGFVYRPVFRATLASRSGNRNFVVDALTGKRVK